MTSQAPCRCADNILITYDENKSKADIPTQSFQYIGSVKFKSYHKNTYKKTYFNWCCHYQATLYNKQTAAYQFLLCSVHSLPSR